MKKISKSNQSFMGILKIDVTDFSDLIHHLLIYVSKLYVLNRISLNSYHVSDYYF